MAINGWAFIHTSGIDTSHYWIDGKTLCGIEAKEEDSIIEVKGHFMCKECKERKGE